MQTALAMKINPLPAEACLLNGPDSILPQLSATGARQILEEMSDLAAERLGLEPHQVFTLLLEREGLGSTGVGHGVAIPHARIGGLSKVHGFFARLKKPVDFNAADGEPVDLVFLLLAPAGAGADHLRALAQVSRWMRDREFCRKLRGTADAEALYALLALEDL